MKRRRFTREEKLSILAPLLAGEQSVTERSEELEIGRTTLQRWLAELSRDGEAAFPGSGPPAGQVSELVRLRRQLAEITRERDILKKAQAYFKTKRP